MLLAVYRGQRHASWEEAFAMFDDLVDTRWGLAARLRLAVSWGKHWVMKQAAADIMAIGPSQVLKLECGRAYAQAGEFPRAREVVAQVAEDESAPSSVRADAYWILVRIVGQKFGEWDAADTLHQDWVRVRPGDTRASAFAPTIASRVAAARAQ
jgi:predicted transcriptional regulator